MTVTLTESFKLISF